MHLRLSHSVEFSYSFQLGDAVREAVTKPWKLPFLPVEVVRRHRKIKLHRKVSKHERDFLFLVDYPKLTFKEREQCSTLFSTLANSIVVVISDEVVDGATHQIPPPTSSNKSPRQWNTDLEHFLQSLVLISKPEKFVFIGQYPYSGIMGLLRKLQPNQNTAWIPAHAKQDALSERGDRFGHVLEWPNISAENEEGGKNHLFLSRNLEIEVAETINKLAAELKVPLSKSPSNALQMLSKEDVVDIPTLLEQRSTAVCIVDSEDEMTQEIEQPHLQMTLCTHEKSVFEHQLRNLLLTLNEGRLFSPTIDLIDEQRWVDLYSSF